MVCSICKAEGSEMNGQWHPCPAIEKQRMEDEFDKVLERWSIRAEDLELGEVIGAGSFGVVRAGTLREGNNRLKVAVKQLPIMDNAQTKEWHKLLQEAVVLAKASERCKSTCRLYGICLQLGYFCLVMKQYVTSLDKKINNYPDRKAPQTLVKQWMLDICQAVAELHSQNIILRDLKLGNVLLDEYEGAILADFGIAKVVESTVAQTNTSNVSGTYAYMAPEMFNQKLGPITMKVDVWALGCLLLELQTGKLLWEGSTSMEIMYKVCMEKEGPTIPSGLHREFVDMLESCFCFDPIERISAMDLLKVLKHSKFWIENEDFVDATCSNKNLDSKFSNLSMKPDPLPSKQKSVEEWIRGGSRDCSLLKMDSLTIGKCMHKDFSSYLMRVSEDGTVYVLATKANKHVINVAVLTNNKTFENVDYPEISYELVAVAGCGGCNSMLSIGAKPLGSHSSKVSHIAVFKDKQFFCAFSSLVNKRTYTTCEQGLNSGNFYIGCSDGAIEVWKPHINYESGGFVFVAELSGHGAPIQVCTVDGCDTVYSLDKLDTNNVRIWRNYTQVANVNFRDAIIFWVSCSQKGRLYITTSNGSIFWQDMKYVAHYSISIVQKRMSALSLFSIPNTFNSGWKDALNNAIWGVGSRGVLTIGSELFIPFQDEDGTPLINSISAGAYSISEFHTVLKMTVEKIVSLQIWYGNVCIAMLNTGLPLEDLSRILMLLKIHYFV